MEAIDGWVWDPIEADFQQGLAALRRFVDREGHPRVPQSHVEQFDGAEINLGRWVSNRRTTYHNDNLQADRVAALEAIDGWVWDRR